MKLSVQIADKNCKAQDAKKHSSRIDKGRIAGGQMKGLWRGKWRLRNAGAPASRNALSNLLVRISFFKCLLLLVLVFDFTASANAADAENLIIAVPGNLPLLLTVPHGGQDSVSGVATRNRGTMVTDTGTIEISEALATRLQKTLGAAPYLVAARFSRKYIDANRSEAEAFESDNAKPVYAAYHDRIRSYITEIKQKFPRGALLLDIHGQADEPNVVMRGTADGATVAALIRDHGADALVGPNSIFGYLQAKGFRVFPPNTPIGDPVEDKRFNGGFTVRTYSRSAEGVDSMQLEVGRYLRNDTAFVDALAEAIVRFYKTYLDNALPARAKSPAASSNLDLMQFPGCALVKIARTDVAEFATQTRIKIADRGSMVEQRPHDAFI